MIRLLCVVGEVLSKFSEICIILTIRHEGQKVNNNKYYQLLTNLTYL